MERRINQAEREMQNTARRHPTLTIATASTMGLIAAALIGAGEAAIAGMAGYLAFRWLRKNRQQKAGRC